MIVNTAADMQIYHEELAPQLPKRIFDAHVHIWQLDAFPPGFSFAPRETSSYFEHQFSLEFWRRCMQEILPEQEVGLLAFPMPHNLADRDKAPKVQGETEFASILLSPADPVEVLQQRLLKNKAVGVKPYLNFAADHHQKSLADLEICDMLSPAQLDYLNQAGLAITLHIPRSLRFADPVNQRQMLRLCRDYPRIRFIFAHMGRAYFLQNIRQSNISELADCPNCYFDSAMVNHSEVLRYCFDHFPAERILFASDAPIALLHGKSVEVNNQYTYLMAEDYEVGSSIYDSKKSLQFTTFFYEQLRAILAACPKQHQEQVFYHNAINLFRGCSKL